MKLPKKIKRKILKKKKRYGWLSKLNQIAKNSLVHFDSKLQLVGFIFIENPFMRYRANPYLHHLSLSLLWQYKVATPIKVVDLRQPQIEG